MNAVSLTRLRSPLPTEKAADGPSVGPLHLFKNAFQEHLMASISSCFCLIHDSCTFSNSYLSKTNTLEQKKGEYNNVVLRHAYLTCAIDSNKNSYVNMLSNQMALLECDTCNDPVKFNCA